MKADIAANAAAIDLRRGRLLSAYQVPMPLAKIDTPDDHVWIITEKTGDESSPVTVLWPSDY